MAMKGAIASRTAPSTVARGSLDSVSNPGSNFETEAKASFEGRETSFETRICLLQPEAGSNSGKAAIMDIAVLAQLLSSFGTLIVAAGILYQGREARKARDDEDRP